MSSNSDLVSMGSIDLTMVVVIVFSESLPSYVDDTLSSTTFGLSSMFISKKSLFLDESFAEETVNYSWGYYSALVSLRCS